MPEKSIDYIDFDDLNKRSISPHIITHLYTADPSAHVFNGKIYIYPSHDIDATNAPPILKPSLRPTIIAEKIIAVALLLFFHSE